MRRRMMMGKKGISSLGYVTDGLIFMFDGIYNSGVVGKHTNDPQKIKELVRGVRLRNDDTFPIDMSCLDNALFINKNDLSIRRFAYFDSAIYADAIRNGTVTCEICCLPSTEQITQYHDQEWGIDVGFGSVYRRWLQNSSHLNIQCNGGAYNVPNNNARSVSAFNSNATLRRTFTQIAPSVDAVPEQHGIYTNGVKITQSTYFWNGNKDIREYNYIASLHQTDVAFSHPFEIHNMRMYNRALTKEEILHNYNVDKLRFNLP